MAPDRIAYRLAFEEGIRARGEIKDQLEHHRTRVTGIFLADLVGAGAAVSGLARFDPTKMPDVPALWLVAVAVGVGCTFAAFVWMIWGLAGQFRFDPRRLVHDYGDITGAFSARFSDDEVYRNLALWLGRQNKRLSRKVEARCRSIYLSLIGVFLTVVGLGGLYTSLLY